MKLYLAIGAGIQEYSFLAIIERSRTRLAKEVGISGAEIGRRLKIKE